MNLHLLISAAALAVLSAVAYADTTVEVSPLLDGWKVFLEQYLFPRAHMRSAQPPSTSLAFSHLTIAHTYHHMFVNCHSGACHRQAQRPLGRRLRRSGHPGTLVPSDIMKTYIPCIDTNLLPPLQSIDGLPIPCPGAEGGQGGEGKSAHSRYLDQGRLLLLT